MTTPLFRQPFHPAMSFVASAMFRLNGVDLKHGDPVDTTDLPVRLVHALYDQRKIDYPKVEPVLAQNKGTLEATPQATPQGTLEATLEATPKQGHDTAPKKDAYRVKHAGLGGWKVIDPKGAPVGQGHKTKAAAQAEADKLNAE